MRYTEKDLKTKYDNFTDYLSSIIELLLLSPFRLVNEISKKVVYLEQKRIEKLLLVATAIATFVIGLEIVIGIFLNRIDLFNGKFPIVLQALTPLIILLIWGFVKNYDFSIHSKLEEILSNSQNSSQSDSQSNSQETKETFDTLAKEVSKPEDSYRTIPHLVEDDPFKDFNNFGEEDNIGEGDRDGIGEEASGLPSHFSQEELDSLQNSNIISAIDNTYDQLSIDTEPFNEVENVSPIDSDLPYDCDGIDPKQFVNEEIYHSQSIKDYKNKHQTTVAKLQERDKKQNKNLMFTEEELQTLQKMCDAAVKTSKYIDDNTIEIALSNQKYDDFSQVDDFMENDDVDWLQQIK